MRNKMFDAIKGLAIISVVFSHTFRGFADPGAIFIREIAMWSVPAFFILQGYFLYSPKPKPWLGNTYKKIKKAYCPYLAWAVFYGFFYYFVSGKHFTLEDVILGKTAIHLYFMFHYMVFAIFLPMLYFIPIFYRKVIIWFMIFSNLALTIILEISKAEQLRIIPYSGPNPVKWWGFVAIGMLLAESPAIISFCRNHRRITIFTAAVLFLFGILQPYAIGHVGYLFNKFALWPMSLGLIILIAVYYNKNGAIFKDELAYMGERTFGIYLPHILILYYLQLIIPGQRMVSVIIILISCILLTNLKNNLEKKITDALTSYKTNH
jgi:surface polysaccharide O-acyltransferase-like enzyme